MGECTIDHSLEDVQVKLQAQEEYLPNNLKDGLNHFLKRELTQVILNDVFHLLKKYDLASEEEREERNKKLADLIQ
ncbi:group-specific protein [Aquibacillus halophilus]|uniref:Group-specific protein n=1 Tax=Aquibacillus halophilus TaxID=930132 RepID=A0A6A8DFN2_9BACI|nr:group-specific protein [Aquibacillus halophilus]MRH44434.1 group-specific protein [Aquibacillus halophilus]